MMDGPAKIMERMYDDEVTPEEAAALWRKWYCAQTVRIPEFDQKENRLLCGFPFVINDSESE
jgi:hypothetical protein